MKNKTTIKTIVHTVKDAKVWLKEKILMQRGLEKYKDYFVMKSPRAGYREIHVIEK